MYLPSCHKKTGTVLMCASDRMKHSKNWLFKHFSSNFYHKNTQLPTIKQTDFLRNLSLFFLEKVK